MTDIHTTDLSDTVIEDADLDTFAASLFGADKTADKSNTNEDSDNGETSDTTSHGDDSTSDPEMGDGTNEDDEGAEDGTTPEETDDTAPVGKKKSRFQERIDDLTAKLRDGDRNRESLEAQLRTAIAKLDEVATVKPVEDTQNTQKPDRGLVEPTSEDLNADGSPKYPLGDFDPKLLRDLTRYDRAIEREHEAKVAAETQAEQARAAEMNTLQTNWNDKVTSAKEVYPDYIEKGQALLNSLQDIPQDYAVYLTQNIMGMDYGPDVFYYLAEHPEEARAIVNSSPEKALNRLGRIEARFEIAADERSGKETKLRTTNAPAPPATRTKGSNAQAPAVDLENADLDTFARELFPRRR
jgi:hypothetical protein